MARRDRLTFTISRTLLATGLVAAMAGCDESRGREPDGSDMLETPTDARTDGRDATSDGDAVGDSSSLDTADLEPDDDTGWYPEEDCCVNPCYDDDGDGSLGGFCAEDCNDHDPDVGGRWRTEACDNKDNDCDGLTDEGEDVDLDGDGYAGAFRDGCETPVEPPDCDDADPLIRPYGGESCDGIDNDCNGVVDEQVPPTSMPAVGFAFCDEVCADLRTSVEHCGACGNVCTDLESCVGGGCCTAPGAMGTVGACCYGDAELDGVCDSPPPACLAAGESCVLDGESPCCEGSACHDVGPGLAVCCLPDGATHDPMTGGAAGCCNKDPDGDGLCGDPGATP